MLNRSGFFRGLVAVSLALCVAVVVPQFAGAQTREDHNDVPGPLDLKRMSLRVTDRAMKFRISTFEGWRSRVLNHSRTQNLLTVRFHTRRPDPFEADLFYRDGRLRVQLIKYCGGCSDPVRAVRKAIRSTRRSVTFSLPRRAVRPRGWIKWAPRSRYVGEGCESLCSDVAPDTSPGYYYYDL